MENTFVKQNLMPTSHNQTVDQRKRYSRLPHASSLPSVEEPLSLPNPTDKYALERSSWTRNEYMRKMEVADATLLKMIMPNTTSIRAGKTICTTGAQPKPSSHTAGYPSNQPLSYSNCNTRES
ncbi:hypothetical protein GQ457_18G014880 [Hibiscus cannabinus]